MSGLWRQLHARTREWAIDANEEWLASLSPDATGARRKPEAEVVLFGPTQVGKTTLLLILLGIREDAAAIVENVLRGGRVHGQSSTALPMRYLRSRDNQWRIDVPEAPGVSEDAVRAHLGAVRAAVEEGRHQGTDPVTLYIPAGYFSAREPLVRVSVLDLPGIAAAAPKERLLVERIARRHLPAAGLILLVGHASKLGLLDPEALAKQLDDLKGWMRSRLRYRLVITHCFEHESMDRRYKNLLNLAAVRAHFVEQIGLFDFPVEPTLGDRLYPLDFGESWSKLLAMPGAYRNWAVQVRAQGLHALAEDVARSCEGDTRLRISQEVREQTLWRADKLREETADAFRAARRDMRRVRARARVTHKAIKRWKERLLSATTALSRLDTALAGIEQAVRMRIFGATISARSTPDGEWELLNKQGEPVAAHVDSLTVWLQEDRLALAEACDCVFKTFNNEAGLHLRAANLRSLAALDKACEHVGEQLGEGRYWTWLSGKFVEDCRSLRAAAKIHRRKIAASLPSEFRDLVRPQRSELARQRRQAAQRCDSLCKLTHRLAEDLTALRATHRGTLADLQQRREALRYDQERVEAFDAQMSRAHAIESREIAERVGKATCAGQAAVALAELCRLRLTRSTLQLICSDSL